MCESQVKEQSRNSGEYGLNSRVGWVSEGHSYQAQNDVNFNGTSSGTPPEHFTGPMLMMCFGLFKASFL